MVEYREPDRGQGTPQDGAPVAVRLLGFTPDVVSRLVGRTLLRVGDVEFLAPEDLRTADVGLIALDGSEGPGLDPRRPELAELRRSRPRWLVATGVAPRAPRDAEELRADDHAPVGCDDVEALSWVLARAVDRRRADEALATAVARYQIATATARDGLFDWDRRTERVTWSSVFEAMLGLDRGQMSPRLEAWIELVHPSEQAEVRRKLRRFLAGPKLTFRFEARVRHATRGFRRMQIGGQALTSPEGEIERVVGSQRDITRTHEREEQLRYAASHDGLTGLANRARFRDRVEHALERLARRPSEAFAVLVIDLDDFKPINDEHGHAAGDAVLVEFAQRLRSCVRPADTVARLGGDEFAVLLDSIDDEATVFTVAERMHDALLEPVQLDGDDEVTSGASIGFVLELGDHGSTEALLDAADQAMYAAKADGSGIARYSGEPADGIDHELEPMTLIPRARDLLARPLVELLERRTVGLDLQARGRDGRPAPLEPRDLERLEEELSGVTLNAGKLRWIDLRLSSACIRTASALAITRRALEAAGRTAIQVRLAVSEDAWVQGGDEWFAGLEQLRASGVSVLLDAFGRRHGPLSALRGGRLDGVRTSPLAFDGDTSSFDFVVRSCLTRGLELVVDDLDEEATVEQAAASGVAIGIGERLGATRPLAEALASLGHSRTVG